MFNFFASKQNSASITPKEVMQQLESGQKVYLIDVRTSAEYASAHIPGSISIPVDIIKSGFTKLGAGKDAEIIVYCQSGARASKALDELTSLGYTNVKTLGGINKWPYETVKGKA